MVDQRTRLYQLIEERLDGTLADYVARSRAASMSWRAMAADLRGRTGLQVSNEILRQWFAHRIEVTVEVKVA
jgi:hypothetical protein